MSLYDNIIAYYPMDGNAKDVSGYGKNGTVSGAVLTTDRFGTADSAYSFDGTDDYIELADGQTPGGLDISTKTAQPTDVIFKPDGLLMVTLDNSTNEAKSYTLSVARDITSATRTGSSTAINAKETSPQGCAFNNDGTKFYVVGQNGKDITYFTCSAYDITTLSYVGEFSLATELATPSGFAFSTDGTKFYVVSDDVGAATVFQYSMTARDMSTAAYASKSVVVETEDTAPTDVKLSSDGTKMYLLGNADNDISIYTLGIARDISTAVYDSIIFYVGGQDSSIQGIFFNPDGLKLYLAGATTKKIFSYTLPTARSFSIPEYQNGFSISAWIKPTTVGEGNAGQIFSKMPGTNGTYGVIFYTGLTNKIAAAIGTTAAVTSATNSVTFGDGNRYHVVLTVTSESKANFYVNGILSGTADQTIGALSQITYHGNARIGNNVTGAQTFNGSIGKTIIWSKTLTAKEVKQVYLSQAGKFQMTSNSIISQKIIEL